MPKRKFIKKIEGITPLDHILNKNFVSYDVPGFIEVGEDNYILPMGFEDNQEKINYFQVRNDDVILAAHPKTGTTLCSELIWLIMNNLDVERAIKEPIEKRFPVIELHALTHYGSGRIKKLLGSDSVTYSRNLKSPRCIKTHLPWGLLPLDIRNGIKVPKIISTVRNAQDVCKSFYCTSKLLNRNKGTFEELCELFLGGRALFGPFWKFVLSYWNEQWRPNILFVKYSEIETDLPELIKKIASFLDKTLSEEDIEILVHNLSYNREDNLMSKYKPDIEKQVYVTAKEEAVMSDEFIERFENWTQENIAGTGLELN